MLSMYVEIVEFIERKEAKICKIRNGAKLLGKLVKPYRHKKLWDKHVRKKLQVERYKEHKFKNKNQ